MANGEKETPVIHPCLCDQKNWLREDIKAKKTFQFGHCPKVGGGVYPCPNFLDTFFDRLIVPKKVIFYPKLTIFVGFSVIFVIIIIKITKILIKIIMATIIIIISIFSIIRAKRRFCRPEKKDQGARIGGWGGGLANSGNARIKTFIFRWCLP